MKIRFEDCAIDFRTRQVERQRAVVDLEPKMYELLEILVKRRPAVVSNDELDELLWPRTYVARSSLTRLVSKLRAALGDSSHDPHIIRTAYKAGYAFCAEVTGELRASNSNAGIELVWNRHRLALVEGEHVVGRDDTCELVVDADTVSRQHARIFVSAGIATIEDLKSTNGTHVNGIQIAGPTRLSHLDTVSLGSEMVRLKRRDAAALTVKVNDGVSKEPGPKRSENKQHKG